MKGYYTSSGYRGLINGQWMLFPTEEEYVEAFQESEVAKQ